MDLFGDIIPERAFACSDYQRVGRAGELLAAFELVLLGANVSMAGEGLPYDLIAQVDDNLWKIQVKSASRVTDRGYNFDAKYGTHRDHRRSRPYTRNQVDVFAFVAVDIRRVLFAPFGRAAGECTKVRFTRAQFERSDASSVTFEICRDEFLKDRPRVAVPQ